MKKAFKISAVVIATLALVALAVGTFGVSAAPTDVNSTNYQEVMGASGKYVLTEDITNQGDAKVRIGTNVTLDLAGNTITTTSATGLFYMFESTPGTFTITDSVGGGAIIVETADAPLFERAGSTVYITGGTIVADRISAEGANPDLHVIITGTGEAGDGATNGTWTKFDPALSLGTGYTCIEEASPADGSAIYRVIPTTYTVELSSSIAGATYGEGGPALPHTLTYHIGDLDITLAAAVVSGYTFTGWYDANGSRVTAIDTDSLCDFEFTARFEPTEFVINYNLPTGAVNAASNPETFTVQTPTITLGEPTLMGAEFVGWYADALHTNPITEIDCANTPNNVSIYPAFTFNDYDITYVLDGATNDPSNPATYTVENTVTFADAVKTGYTFLGWFDAEEGGNQVTGIQPGTIAEPITLYARFEITEYTIDYVVPEGATLPENAPTTYTILDNITFGVPTLTGATFTGWTGTTEDGVVITNNQLLAGTTGNLTLTANWNMTSYRIEYILNDSPAFPVTNNPNQHIQSYTIADTITLEPAVRTHYDFVGWFESMDEDAEQVTVIPEGTTGNITLYARWTPTQYTVTYDFGGVEGVVMPESDTVVYDEEMGVYTSTYDVETTLVFPDGTLRVGYDVVWLCDGEEVTQFTAGEWYGDKTLVATWKVATWSANIIYQLTDEYVEQNGISATDAILYSETVTLTYGQLYTHTVKFASANCNGFVPDHWVVEVTPEATYDKDGAFTGYTPETIIVYFSPVVVSTVYEDGNIVITYKDGTKNTIEISSIAGIALDGNALVYTLANGQKVTVASIATTTDLDAVEESVDALNESLTALKTALESKDSELAEDIAANAESIRANAEAIEQNAAAILANTNNIAANAADIKVNADAIAALEAAVASINSQISGIESDIDGLAGTDTGLIVGIIIIAVVLAGVAGCVVFLFIKQRKA